MIADARLLEHSALTLYRVTKWDESHENHRSRELKTLASTFLPNKTDGDGYTELVVDHPSGAAHYGVWVALLHVAGKSSPRGVLVREGGRPHDVTSLARITRMPAELIDEALPRLVAIGWLTVEPQTSQEVASPTAKSRGAPRETAPTPRPRACARNGTELNGNQRTGSGESSGSFKEVDEDMLRCEQRTEMWRLAAYKRYGCLGSQCDQHFVQSAAAHALRCGDNPPAMFVTSMKSRINGDGTDTITNDDDAEGYARLRRLESTAHDRRSDFVARGMDPNMFRVPESVVA